MSKIIKIMLFSLMWQANVFAPVLFGQSDKEALEVHLEKMESLMREARNKMGKHWSDWWVAELGYALKHFPSDFVQKEGYTKYTKSPEVLREKVKSHLAFHKQGEYLKCLHAHLFKTDDSIDFGSYYEAMQGKKEVEKEESAAIRRTLIAYFFDCSLEEAENIRPGIRGCDFVCCSFLTHVFAQTTPEKPNIADFLRDEEFLDNFFSVNIFCARCDTLSPYLNKTYRMGDIWRYTFVENPKALAEWLEYAGYSSDLRDPAFAPRIKPLPIELRRTNSALKKLNENLEKLGMQIVARRNQALQVDDFSTVKELEVEAFILDKYKEKFEALKLSNQGLKTSFKEAKIAEVSSEIKKDAETMKQHLEELIFLVQDFHS